MKFLTLVPFAAGIMFLLTGCEETYNNYYDSPAGDDEVARVVRQAGYGGYIVAGEKYYADGPADQADLYLVFLSESGHVEWDLTYSTNMHNEPLAARQTADGGFLILSERSNSSAHALYLLKVSDDGQVQWMNEVPANNLNHVMQAVSTQDGGFAILGYSGSNDNIALMKIDGAGVVQFLRTYGDNGTTADLHEVDGGYILLNTISRNADSTIVELIRTDSWGEPQWSSEIWSYGLWVAWYVVQDADGGYLIVSETNSGTLESAPMMIKVDLRGSWLWRRDYGESSGVTIYAVVSGWTGPLIAGEVGYDSGANDGFAMRTTNGGDLLWWRSFGGSANDWIQNADVTDDGGFILAGGSTSYSAAGDADFYVAKISVDGTRQWETVGGGNPN